MAFFICYMLNIICLALLYEQHEEIVDLRKVINLMHREIKK